METWMIILAVLVILVLWVIKAYNKLILKRSLAKTQWSQIDVELKRRVNLIPNLVNTIKGATKHESETFVAVVNARNSYLKADGINEQIESGNQMTAALGKMFALAESYPDLKASQNFMGLQKELSEIEEKIAVSRRFFNDAVLTYNLVVHTIPTNIIASLFKFEAMKQFEAVGKDRENVEVDF